MSDELNKQIESWRRTLSELSPQQADELEDHLRCEAAALCTRSGLTAAEGFTIAAMRVGQPTALIEEFVRADAAAAWSMRLRWMVMGFLVCMLANLFLSLLNDAVGFALIEINMPLALLIALRILSLSVVIFAAIAAWHAWLRRGGEDALRAQPPRWLTAGWTLAIMLAALPWLSVGFNGFDLWFWTRLTPRHATTFAFSGNITRLVLPFTTPLILLII